MQYANDADLHAESTETDADLGEVESTLLVQTLGRERGCVGNTVFLDEFREHGNSLSFSHDSHRINFWNLERLVVPVNFARIQFVDQSESTQMILNNNNIDRRTREERYLLVSCLVILPALFHLFYHAV